MTEISLHKSCEILRQLAVTLICALEVSATPRGVYLEGDLSQVMGVVMPSIQFNSFLTYDWLVLDPISDRN